MGGLFTASDNLSFDPDDDVVDRIHNRPSSSPPPPPSLPRPPEVRVAANRQRLNQTVVARRLGEFLFLDGSLETICGSEIPTVDGGCCCAISNDSLVSLGRKRVGRRLFALGEVLTLSSPSPSALKITSRDLVCSNDEIARHYGIGGSSCVSWSPDPCSVSDWYAVRTSSLGKPMPIVSLYGDTKNRIVGCLEVPGKGWDVVSLAWCPWRPCIVGAVHPPNRSQGFLVYDASERLSFDSLGFHDSEHRNSISSVDACEETKVFVSGSADYTVKVWDLRGMRRLSLDEVSSVRMPIDAYVGCVKVVSEERALYVLQVNGNISKLDMRQLNGGVVWSKQFHCRFRGSRARSGGCYIQRFEEGVFVSSVNCSNGGSITKWTREGEEIQSKDVKDLVSVVCLAEWRLKRFAVRDDDDELCLMLGEEGKEEEEEGEEDQKSVFSRPVLACVEKQARWEFLLDEARNENSCLFDLHYVVGDFHFSLWRWIVPAAARPSGSVDGNVVHLSEDEYLWAFTQSQVDAEELLPPFIRMLIDPEGAEFQNEQILDLFILSSGLHLWRRAFFFMSLLGKIGDELLIVRFVDRLTRAERRCPALEAFYEECLDVLSHLSLPAILRTGEGEQFLERLRSLGIVEKLQTRPQRAARLAPFDNPSIILSSSLREIVLDDLYSLHHGDGRLDADVTLVTHQNDEILAHLGILVARMGFFFRMVHFGGSELTSFRENATIRVQVIETEPLNCLLEWIYTERMTSASFRTVIDLLRLAEIHFEQELWDFVWKIVVQRSYGIRASGRIQESLGQYLARWETLPIRLREFWEENGMTEEKS